MLEFPQVEGRAKSNADNAKQYDALAKQTADAQAAADEAKADAASFSANSTPRIAASPSAHRSREGRGRRILAAMSAEDEDGIAANADKLAASYAALKPLPVRHGRRR